MMTKVLIPVVLAVHAVAHLPGFLAAFNISRFTMTRPVPQWAGLLWLAAALLFLAAAGMLALGRSWGYMGLPAIVISQLLVILWWRDARPGTIVNAIIILPALLNIAAVTFRTRALAEAATIMRSARNAESLPAIPAGMPAPVVKWLEASGAIKAGPAHTLRLKQKGKMRMKPGDKWRGVTAEQYFNTDAPSFLWLANIDAGMYSLAGKDVLEQGKGRMVIKVGAMVTVADATGPEQDQGTMLRYLAEMQWFPQAALSPYIAWEALGHNSATAILSHAGKSVKGIFYFNDKGDITAFEAKRYMERKGKYSLETWYVPVTAYATFEGVRVPSRGNAVWKLKEGDFNWFRWEVTEINYSKPLTY